MVQRCALSVCGCILERASKRLPRCAGDAFANREFQNPLKSQALCGEAPTLKRLAHPNIVPFLGVTFTPFQLVSPWISLDLPKYIEKNPQADRLQLVGASPATFIPHLPSY